MIEFNIAPYYTARHALRMSPEKKAEELGVTFTILEPGYLNL